MFKLINNQNKNLELCLEQGMSIPINTGFIGINRPSLQESKSFQFILKRLMDILLTVIGVFFIAPLLVAVAIAIKTESRGPVLFKQKRVGKQGREFYMYKFRSMSADAEQKLKELQKFNETNAYMFKMFDDPRVTKVGKFIRKFSIDELPQLINVLKGEMSLVGFRPPTPDEVLKYEDWYHLRFEGMPGLTGPWQVGGRSTIKNFETVVEMEYNYHRNWSIVDDVVIMAKTVPVVLFGKDAA